MAPIIRASGISKRYQLGTGGSGSLYQTLAGGVKRLLGRGDKTPRGEFWALRDVDFDIERGDVVGIVGRNGAGKSTLLKVLSRITQPTSGRIEIEGRLASLLEVGTGFHPELTGRENIFLNGAILGMSKGEIRSKFDEIVDFSGIERFLDTPVKRYSSGMYVRLAFAVAAHLEPEILVIDEVLAVGDAEFQTKCLRKMDSAARSGRTILFVSHNMAAVKNLCSKGIFLQQGRVQYMGDIHQAIDLYMAQAPRTEKRFEQGVVRCVRAGQQGERLVLEVEYAFEHDPLLPNLSFVLNDRNGNPLFGMTPFIHPEVDTENRNGGFARQGKVSVEIRQPVLLDGLYAFSVWFGDKAQTVFQEMDCVNVEVVGMTTLPQPHPAERIGCAVPECLYKFD